MVRVYLCDSRVSFLKVLPAFSQTNKIHFHFIRHNFQSLKKIKNFFASDKQLFANI